MERETIGDFRIISQIGRGPLGDLYLGEHKFMKKRFAIKVLPTELMECEGFLERFESGISLVCGLEHMNLAKVHTVSSDAGLYYLVTDYIADPYGESKNLAAYLGSLDKRLTEDEVFSILRQVAYALDYIHTVKFDGKQMSHGGIKLTNILVGKFNDGIPHVYLTDTLLGTLIGQGRILTKTFAAVAKALEIAPECTGLELTPRFSSREVDAGKLTKLHRSFLQNYAFLAPEQKLGGTAEKIQSKADIYAFGVLAYFLLMVYLPEGRFKMPSALNLGFRRNWDLLIEATLRQSPEGRPDSLVALLAEMETKELGETLPSVTRTLKEEPAQAPAHSVAPPAPPKLVTSAHFSFEERLTQTAGKGGAVKLVRKTEEIKPQAVAATLDAEEQVEELQVLIKPSEVKKFEFDDDPGAIFQSQKVVEPYKPVKKEAAHIEPILTEMSLIPGGVYFRGSNTGARDEKVRHKVEVRGFAIDIHPVTNEQFIRFLELMGCEKNSDNNDMILLKESRIKRVGGKLIIESGYTKHPVVGVSWYGAEAYAKWIGKRLPTEAEWEIAASLGKDENIYPVGMHIERSQANFFSSDTTPVMSYKPGENGLYDMAGNVYEWCEDWYGYNYYETSLVEPMFPKGPAQGVYRVLRGGCWKSLVEDMRVSHRHRNNPGTMNRTYGFRLVADVK